MIEKRTLLRAMAWLVAAGAGLLLILGLLGAHAQRLDALAAFRWHALALLVLALLAAKWPQRAFVIAALSPVIILGQPILLASRPAAPPAVASPAADIRAARPRALRVVTFNTWDSAQNIDEVHQFLRRADADVAVLVEVSPPKRALLDLLKPSYPYQVHCSAIWQCSMALVSRLPFEAHGAVLPSMTMPAAVWGRIGGDGGGVTVLGVHVHRPTRSPRVHWGHIRGVADLTRAAKGSLIVAGDFNSPDWSASMRWLRQQTGLLPMPQTLPTWPAWPVSVPQFPIDHILISPDLRLEELVAGPAAGSDHLPITGMVQLGQTLSRSPPPTRPRQAGMPK